ncbi:aldo/keto reductase [Microbacterium sp. MPKO10]|uniref:aldo/keto reductase n=1 Tax=Microbacterium sp. MPKO10 TaxID=2989818 RepID=UPI0022364796|nr:aldo/keto reductase [Microbacterium sp. MPKO10]MCW4458643.1 aldo/keto reductase [Microbacterium sp. MPKO10]
MNTARLGTSEVEVSRLSLGSWYTYSRLSFEAGTELVRTALDRGITFFDVAYYRNSPHTEMIFSRLIRETGVKRTDYQLAEKLWYFGYPEESLSDQTDRMLRRIDEEYVDTLIIEHPRPGMSVEKLVDEISAVVGSGRARSWGALNWVPEDLLTAYEYASSHGLAGPVLAQLKYSLVRRNVVEEQYRQVIEQTGMSIHASDTMEGGILAGILKPERHIGIDVGGIREQIKNMVPKIAEAARKLDITPAQFSLAWCLTNPQVASVLFGATRPERLRENLEAMQIAEDHGDQIRAVSEGLGIDAHALDAPYKHDKALIGDYVA